MRFPIRRQPIPTLEFGPAPLECGLAMLERTLPIWGDAPQQQFQTPAHQLECFPRIGIWTATTTTNDISITWKPINQSGSIRVSSRGRRVAKISGAEHRRANYPLGGEPANPITSVSSAAGVPRARKPPTRALATGIGVATVGAGFWNIGVAAGGLVYAAFPPGP